MNLVCSRLDEQQRRWYVALESNRIGHGGDHLLSQITGLDEKTIRRGREELATSLADRPSNHVPRPGGGPPPTALFFLPLWGRPTVEKKTRR